MASGFWLLLLLWGGGAVAGQKTLQLKLKRREPSIPPDILQSLLNNATCGSNCHAEILSHEIRTPEQSIESQGISYIDVTLGTPSQTLRVVFDTGSAQLWVAREQDCQDQGGEGSICTCTTFKEPSSSTTITNDLLQIKYGSGHVEGVYADDTNLILGNAKCRTKMELGSSFKFGLGMDHEGAMYDMSGILGMSYAKPDDQRNGQVIGDSLMQKLVDAGMAPKFSTFARQCSPPQMGNKCSNGGVVTFGKFDTKNCGKELVTVDLKNYRNRGSQREHPYVRHFRFDVEGIWMETASGREETQWQHEAFETISDSGCSGIVLQRSMWEGFRRLLPSDCREKGHSKICPCDITFTLFVRINGVTIPIPSRNLMLTTSSDGKWCKILFSATDTPGKFNFGDPFFRTVCHHYHWDEKKITFAETLNK